MRKLTLGLLVTVLSLVAVLGSIYWYNLMFTPSGHPDWMNQMMSQMMGSNAQPLTAPLHMFLIPLLFFVPLLAGVMLIGYFSLYPEIRMRPSSAGTSRTHAQSASFETILKTMKPEEGRLLEILRAHNGVSLQKDLRRESGLTRLQVHRMIARFAERGIIRVRESGNTNEITLEDWLRK